MVEANGQGRRPVLSNLYCPPTLTLRMRVGFFFITTRQQCAANMLDDCRRVSMSRAPREPLA